MIDSERLDLASASSAYRRRQCTGSQNLIAELRKAAKLQAPLPDSDAQSGTTVHAAWAGNNKESLSSMQTETLEHLQRMERLLVTDWAGHDQYTLLGREVRLWLHNGLEPVHSGQFDAAYGTIHSQRMLILDAKTLFEEVSPAESNDQLRELVALARFNYPRAREFTVAILQPWVSQRPSIAVYDQIEAELALRLLRATLADAADPDAPRTPGTWCKHCPAIAQCEEAREHSLVAYSLAKRIEKGEYVLPAGTRGAQVLDWIVAAEPVLRALKERYKVLLQSDPESIPNWYLKDGKKVREIIDIRAAYETSAQAGISLEDFLASTSLKITALQERFGLARNLKGKALSLQFNDTFSSLITLKACAPELAKASHQKKERTRS